VNSQKEAFAAVTKTKKAKVKTAKVDAVVASPHYERLLTLLRKERVRPLKRKGLLGKLKSWFPALDLGHREALLQRLFGDGHVRDANGSMTYHL
jgi:hypothetical protein